MLYSHSNFQVYNKILLTIISMLYVKSSELTHLTTKSWYPLMSISLFSTTPSPSWPFSFIHINGIRLNPLKEKENTKEVNSAPRETHILLVMMFFSVVFFLFLLHRVLPKK